VLSDAITRVLLPGISSSDAHSVAQALIPFSLGLAPLGMTLLIKRVFYAFENGKTVFLLQIPMSLALIIGSIVTINVLSPKWWVVGIASSYALSYIVGVFLRLHEIKKILNGIDGKNLLSMHIKAIFSCLIACICGFLFKHFYFWGLTIVQAILQIIIIGFIMTVIYFGLTYALKSRELFEFIRNK
jgi:putative peptidoglycan lipid II flippase